jgi:L-lactate dehydrogenase complex protein LldE
MTAGATSRVTLFVTCLVDQLRPATGVAAARVLARAGCRVEFDPRQTCCGQPAYNAGHLAEATAVARRFLELHARADAVVLPSGSCTAMVKHMQRLFPAGTSEHARAQEVAAKTFELAAFLVRVLGREDLGARFDGRLAWHDACHGLRDLGLAEEPRRLLARVRGAELVAWPESSACCGFGGTFSVAYPELSTAILDRKIDALAALGVDAVVSSDASCLLQLGGRLARRGIPVRALHLAEVLEAR